MELSNKAEALKAVSKLNGTIYKGRTISLDLSVQKELYSHFLQKSKENPKKTEEDEDSADLEQAEPEEDQVPATLNQEEDEEENEENEQEENEEEGHQGEEEKEEEEPKGWLAKRPLSEFTSKNDDKHQSKKVNVGAESSEENDEKAKKKLEEMSRTLFVKNIDPAITDQDFKKYMKSLAPCEYALLVKDKSTNMNKGTGFVRFAKQEDAEVVAEHSRLLDQGQAILPLSNQPTLHLISVSLLTAIQLRQCEPDPRKLQNESHEGSDQR